MGDDEFLLQNIRQALMAINALVLDYIQLKIQINSSNSSKSPATLYVSSFKCESQRGGNSWV